MKNLTLKFSSFLKLVFSIVLLFGCTKEHANRWIVVKVTVLDYYTHEPIKASANLEYKIYGLFGTFEESSAPVGNTNSDGVITIKHQLPRKAKSIKLRIDGPMEYSFPNTFWPLDRRNISSGSDEDYTVYAKPYYKVRIHTHNQNCTGPTDSLWVTCQQVYPLIVTGCGDQDFSGPNNYFTHTQTPYVQITSKKNGVTLDLSQNFTLDPSIINDIHINY